MPTKQKAFTESSNSAPDDPTEAVFRSLGSPLERVNRLVTKARQAVESGKSDEALLSLQEAQYLIEEARGAAPSDATNSTIENIDLICDDADIVQPPVKTGDATLEQAQAKIGQVIESLGFAKAAKLFVGAASPDERALLASMVDADLVAGVLAPKEPTFTELLALMSPDDRKAALNTHYTPRKSWAEVRRKKPMPGDMLAWLDTNFPDRREIGMVLSDLAHLDEDAYEKVMAWRTKRAGIPAEIIDSLCLPSGRQSFDPERDANAPKSWNEVIERAERGEDTFRNLNNAFARARRHPQAT